VDRGGWGGGLRRIEMGGQVGLFKGRKDRVDGVEGMLGWIQKRSSWDR
jgi:hypothetical protein